MIVTIANPSVHKMLFQNYTILLYLTDDYYRHFRCFHLQVFGVGKLRVVDSSIMPEIITGHTSVPSMMIAEKAADMIKQDHS